MRALLEHLGHPEMVFPSIHVGGTNGKGSVCTLLYEALTAAGYRVGLYTSPHLVDVRERMIVANRPITRDAFSHWAAQLFPMVEAEDASFFEVTTAIALADFAARHVDVAVIEVGLGGRLDATNVVEPLVSAVTSIALDHADYLGDSLEQIAEEKAGIAKAGVPLVIGETDPHIVEVLVRAALRVEAEPVVLPPTALWEGDLALVGAHQRRNAAIARAILVQLPTNLRPEPQFVAHAFKRASIPGRADQRGKWLFDVAHNPASIKALVALLPDLALRRPLHAVVGFLSDKHWEESLALLRPVVDRLWATHPPSAPEERRWNLEAVASAAGGWAAVEPNLGQALQAAEAGAGAVLVTGSFHTVGDAMARLPGFAPLG